MENKGQKIKSRFSPHYFSFFNISSSCNGGFTLLETVIALTVITAATVGPVSLIGRGLVNFSFAKNKIIAVGLAQEGVELVHLVRENNKICDSLNGPPPWAWNRDPDGGNLTNTSRRVDATDTTTISCGGSTINTPRLPLFAGEKLRYNAATGFYGYDSGSPETLFTREIRICVPPNSSTCGATADGDIPSSDQMEIISIVSWTERGSTRIIQLSERLYDWD